MKRKPCKWRRITKWYATFSRSTACTCPNRLEVGTRCVLLAPKRQTCKWYEGEGCTAKEKKDGKRS